MKTTRPIPNRQMDLEELVAERVTPAILDTPSIHCSCGHSARMEDFCVAQGRPLANNELACPECHTHFRRVRDRDGAISVIVHDSDGVRQIKVTA